MDAAGSSETSVYFCQTKCRDIIDDRNAELDFFSYYQHFGDSDEFNFTMNK